MHVTTRRLLGSFCVALGIVVLLSAVPPFTGAVIGAASSSAIASLFGLAFIVAGIILLSSGEEREAYEARESKLRKLVGERYEHLPEREQIAHNKAFRRHEEAMKWRSLHAPAEHHEQHLPRIIRTTRFEKAIQDHDEAAIERAIGKIGTGLGRAEKLKHQRGYSIRVSKGGRIIYDRTSNGSIKLQDYLPDHRYA